MFSARYAKYRGRGGQLSRKQRRKQERVAKKAKAAARFSRRRQQIVPRENTRKAEAQIRKRGRDEALVRLQKAQAGGSLSWRGQGDVGESRKASLLAANKREDREIAKLEKLLNLKKRKKKQKRLPASFHEEGLDYLLDLTDKDSNEWTLSEEEVEGSLSESGEEPEEAETRVFRSHKASRKRAIEAATPDSVPRSQKKLKLEWKSIGEEEKEEEGEERDGNRSEKKLKVDLQAAAKKGILKQSLSKAKRGEKSKSDKKHVRFSLEGSDTVLLDLNPEYVKDWVGNKEHGVLLNKSGGSECMEGEDSSESDGFYDDDDDDDEDLGMEGKEEVEEEWEEEEEEDEEEDEEGEEEEEWEEMEEDVGEQQEEGEEDKGGEGGSASGSSVSEVAPDSPAMKYVPPNSSVRGGSLGEGKGRISEKLRKKVQGLINRLSESNMQSICKQLEQLYMENSRNDMNTTLTTVLLKACATPTLLSDRFAMEHAMLVAILHSHVGTEVGAHVVQALAVRLDELLGNPPNYGRGRECNSVLLLLAHLYNYKVIHCLLVYDVIRRLVESFTERDVELLVLLLKNTGMEIRKDDATSLKDIILQIQSKAAASPGAMISRMRFMLDTIKALRTNNVRKIPNYDPSLLEHMKKLLRRFVRSTGTLDEGQLKISLQDLLNADKQGRWWVVGSAWTGKETSCTGRASTAATVDSWVLELARQQRMNTDVRKNIFSVLMTSEDYADAFEKLLRLGLKDIQEREIIHILVDCCLQEKEYNPYYAFLGQKFCEFKRSHQVTFQYVLWDRFKVLNSLSPSNRTNLCRLCSHLISTRALSLAILRVVEFAELEKTGTKFYKRLLQSLLCDYSEEICRCVFARLAPLPHLKPLRDNLLVFMRHFLHKRSPTINRGSGPLNTLINERITIAEQAMRTEGCLF